jgi:hypothetical protein
MNRAQLEHVIRASSTITDDDEIVVIGSQSVLGQFPDAPPAMRVSMEADVYPRNHPERWDLIDGTIGEGSMFHETFGYYAQGVDESTAVLPAGWKERLIPIRGPGTRGATGWTLEIHDLLISKYIAGRDKDLDFTAEAVRHGMTDADILRERLAHTSVDPALRALVEGRIRADFAASSGHHRS